MGCGICKPDPKVLDKEVIPNELLDSSEHYIGPIDAKEIEDDEAVVEAQGKIIKPTKYPQSSKVDISTDQEAIQEMKQEKLRNQSPRRLPPLAVTPTFYETSNDAINLIGAKEVTPPISRLQSEKGLEDQSKVQVQQKIEFGNYPQAFDLEISEAEDQVPILHSDQSVDGLLNEL